jgi:hypothetical protein
MKRALRAVGLRSSLSGIFAGLALSGIGACGSFEPVPNGAAGGSGSNNPPSTPVDVHSPSTPGSVVTLSVSTPALEPILTELDTARSLDAESLLASRAVSFESTLGHDPEAALGLPEIQRSSLALNGAELEQLGENGFVILRRKQYPSFPYGYFDIYAADLPVYVTADMVLEAVHRSYDEILKQVERAGLIPRLTRLLGAMRTRLSSNDGGLSESAAKDADFFLSVAQSLASGSLARPVAGADAAQVRAFVEKATAASGAAEMTIFDTVRELDFS